MTDPARPPKVPGLPVIGHGLRLRTDPLRFFVELYREYGPIFRVRAFHRRFTVLAGLDANLFLSREGETYLGSERLFGGMAKELDTEAFLVAMDGPPHRNLRKQMRRGYSKTALAPGLDGLASVFDDATADWKAGDVIPVLPFFRRLVTDQLGDALMGRRPGAVFDDISYFLNALLKVKVMKTWPEIALRRMRYRRARANTFEFVAGVLADHRAGKLPRSDLVEDTLALQDMDGNPYAENVILAAAIGPYFAGMDTVASTLCYVTYGVLKHEEFLPPVVEEADRAMASDDLFGELRGFQHLHATILECLRLWPVAPFTPRDAVRDFEFGGCRVEEGDDVLVAQCVTHLLEEYFPDPERYDLARHLERKETRRTGVYAPFTLGAHTCLGAGMAEVQLMVNLALLLNRFDVELEEPDEPVPVISTPVPNPGRRFAIRVRSRR